ncbi:phytanoyl-CoA dioxygenase family protein [Alicyclobacillus fastidiosus]|uniref:Phytanoyl-CoA dioxygenase family protein n=1 Tax=Alicyclobacillus fastidiosus TaxID=392011 RepID=A0ABY6ZME1_9BACL|nr:phytanoyl-CoA dioxygenase family protein [Alicyclobacillus fastidiosus]WAH44098.1 phytanoyl-CoA dioxygenase family protein [Alicyclobacillus fastidiosus]GMA60393.1 hypothetical protein GCM10025859_08330 [Alicyclobacillus fastidiosus]
MNLTYAQKKAFYENGFIKIPGVVPQIMVDSALKAINHSIGEGLSAEDMVIMRAQSYCKELVHEPVITDLFNKTAAWELSESLLGQGHVPAVSGGQIALRFPGLQDPPHKPGSHLDGMYTPTNGVPQGTIQNFTMLVGVYLNSVRLENAGNLTVWPGTHHTFEEYFREHGAEALLEGMPKVDMPDPVQITVEPGDVVFAHYQLAHGTAPNISPNVRYAIYFRLTHTDFDRSQWQAPMRNIWMHYPGIRELLLGS